MRTRTLTLQARLDGQYKRPDVLGIPVLTQDQILTAWSTYGDEAMCARWERVCHQHKINNIRHNAGMMTHAQYDRALSRTVRRMENIQYW